MKTEYDIDFEKVMNELQANFGWSNIDVLPNSYKDLLNDAIKAVKNCSIPAVMGSFVKSLKWIDNPKKRSGDIYKVISRADVPMPHTVGNACIEITEHTYPNNYYEATLWCFNRGTGICEGKTVDEAKSNAFKWWSDFVCGFLNCP